MSRHDQWFVLLVHCIKSPSQFVVVRCQGPLVHVVALVGVPQQPRVLLCMGVRVRACTRFEHSFRASSARSSVAVPKGRGSKGGEGVVLPKPEERAGALTAPEVKRVFVTVEE